MGNFKAFTESHNMYNSCEKSPLLFCEFSRLMYFGMYGNIVTTEAGNAPKITKHRGKRL